MASRDEKKAATREKLLEAAAALVGKQGALATSLDAIAEYAGLTKGAVYSNFDSKEDLLFELAGLSGMTINLEDVFGDESQAINETLEQIGREIAAQFRAASSKTWRLTYEILNFAQHNARTRREIADDWRRSRKLTAEWFDRVARAQGRRLALGGAEISLVIEALALGVAQLQRIDPKAVPEDLIPRVLRLLVDD